MKTMNVVLLNAGFDRKMESTAGILDRYWHVPKLAEALAGLGHHVTVIQAFHHDESSQRGNLAFEFVGTSGASGNDWSELTATDSIQTILDAARADVVHLFGLTMLPMRRSLGRWCRTNGVRLTASFHGGRPHRSPIGWWRQRQAMAATSVVFFPSEDSADLWRRAKLLPRETSVEFASEVSSPFCGVAQNIARSALGIDGHPVLAWSGHLDANKDPITALKGMRQILNSWPEAIMLMAYQSTQLLPDVQAYLQQNRSLRDRVTLLGELKHNDIETLFSAANFFVHTSHREWGSNALVEALSCGAIPVVTDLPSLRALCRDIPAAIVFPTGDSDSLAEQTVRIPIGSIDGLSADVKSAYDEHLSYAALAARYATVFEGLVEGRQMGAKL